MPRKQSAINNKTKRSAILHFWNKGERSPTKIATLTKIHISTVKYNIAKIKEQGTIEDRPRSDRPCKLGKDENIVLGQWLRRNSETTTNELAKKLQERGENVSRWTVQRQLKKMGYRNVLPHKTPILTKEHKEARVQWAI